MIFVIASLIGLFVYMSLWYIYAIKRNDLSLVDVAYGTGFVVIAISMMLYSTLEPIRYIVASLVIIWGIRLTYTIAKRKVNKPEDWRYTQMRNNWGNNYKQKAFINVFMLQGLLILIISAPILVVANYYRPFGIIQTIGLLVWITGFLIEFFADYQLKSFISSKNNHGKILQSGLWKYSRHPNYFGEVLQWWGLWLIVFMLPFGWLATVSPLTITVLILFVSGVPLLEKKYKSNRNYQNYAKRTSIFVPRPPKKG